MVKMLVSNVLLPKISLDTLLNLLFNWFNISSTAATSSDGAFSAGFYNDLVSTITVKPIFQPRAGLTVSSPRLNLFT